ncbi:uncharacterized protein TNCV_943541 [Trichonephila clavipes]|nr:uncharacterized protein TNCV_943541 [Trichonephila clavipes]
MAAVRLWDPWNPALPRGMWVAGVLDEENKQKEQTLREFELQKIRLQNETQRVVDPQTLPQTKIELKKLLPTFNPEVDNMDLFLTLFERQMKLLDLGEDLWVPYLIGALPSDVTFLIAPDFVGDVEPPDNQQPEHCCRIKDAGINRHHGRAADFFGGVDKRPWNSFLALITIFLCAVNLKEGRSDGRSPVPKVTIAVFTFALFTGNGILWKECVLLPHLCKRTLRGA